MAARRLTDAAKPLLIPKSGGYTMRQILRESEKISIFPHKSTKFANGPDGADHQKQASKKRCAAFKQTQRFFCCQASGSGATSLVRLPPLIMPKA